MDVATGVVSVCSLEEGFSECAGKATTVLVQRQCSDEANPVDRKLFGEGFGPGCLSSMGHFLHCEFFSV